MESFLIQVQVAKLSEIDSLLGYGIWIFIFVYIWTWIIELNYPYEMILWNNQINLMLKFLETIDD